MTDGPDWAETLSAVKKVPGKGRTKNDRLGMDQVAQWQEFQQQRTGADVAVAVGGVDTGDDFDGWGHFTNWAADQLQSLANIWNGWFGSGGTGTPTEVRTTIEAIRVAVSNGYTLQTITTNGTFNVPSGITELNGIVIGGGGNGASGGVGNGTRAGGAGGIGGAYVFKQLDLSVLIPGTAVLTCTVGAGGTGSGGAGSVSTIKDSGGTTLLTSAAGLGGVALPQGMMSTTSSAGNGGNGGDANSSGPTATAGTAGGSSGVATGGAGGTAKTQSGGSGGISAGGGADGTAGQTSDVPLVGGSGGGGGGGCGTNTTTIAPFGGAGGNGGFPGGGGGGSGAGAGFIGMGTHAYGLGANGIIAFLYK